MKLTLKKIIFLKISFMYSQSLPSVNFLTNLMLLSSNRLQAASMLSTVIAKCPKPRGSLFPWWYSKFGSDSSQLL